MKVQHFVVVALALCACASENESNPPPGVEPAIIHVAPRTQGGGDAVLTLFLDPNADARQSFTRMAELFAGLTPVAAGRWDTLSMGMSNDYEQAIMAGATHVRIGTAIFGARGG